MDADTMNYGAILDEIENLESIIPKIDDAIARGADWLISQSAPHGPIMGERDLSLCHKVAWGLYEANRIPQVVRLLDWIDANAKRAPGEYYFPEESPYQKDRQRVYRFLTFGKIAEMLKHPAYCNDETRERIFQYQHPSGGVFANIDEGKALRLEPLNTTFFGQWAIAAGFLDKAEKAGDFIVELVELNAKHFEADRMFFVRDPQGGNLITEFSEDVRLNFYIDTKTIKQPSWVTGTCIALLADLYAINKNRTCLDAACKLADFEARCDYRQLFWPSKCKCGWGEAELYRVTADPMHRKLAADVARVTFLDAQLPHGGWSHMFYPVKEDGGWRKAVYGGPERSVPENLPDDGSYGRLSSHEITGEFMGELGRIKVAFQDVLHRLRYAKRECERDTRLRG